MFLREIETTLGGSRVEEEHSPILGERLYLLETYDRLFRRAVKKPTEKETTNMGKSQNKLDKYDTPVFC